MDCACRGDGRLIKLETAGQNEWRGEGRLGGRSHSNNGGGRLKLITSAVTRGIEDEERNPMITAIPGRYRFICER